MRGRLRACRARARRCPARRQVAGARPRTAAAERSVRPAHRRRGGPAPRLDGSGHWTWRRGGPAASRARPSLRGPVRPMREEISGPERSAAVSRGILRPAAEALRAPSMVTASGLTPNFSVVAISFSKTERGGSAIRLPRPTPLAKSCMAAMASVAGVQAVEAQRPNIGVRTRRILSRRSVSISRRRFMRQAWLSRCRSVVRCH